MTDKRLVLTTTGSEEEARSIASALVGRRLAACVNIVPRIESVYRWKGEVETSVEWLLIIKTTEALFSKIREVLPALHSYEVPECIELEIQDGSNAYLKWIEDSVLK